MLREPFSLGDSFIHQLDPRIRLLSAGTFSIVVALSYDFAVLITALMVSFLLVWFAQLSARRIIKRILVVNGFIVLLWLVLPESKTVPVVAKQAPTS